MENSTKVTPCALAEGLKCKIILVKTGDHYDALKCAIQPQAFHSPQSSSNEISKDIFIASNPTPLKTIVSEQGGKIGPISSKTDLCERSVENEHTPPQNREKIVTQTGPPRPPPAKPKKINRPISPKLLIRMVGLNVSGFLNKYEKGILDVYLSNFEIICLSETHTEDLPPNFTKSALGEYSCFTKKKKDTEMPYQFGGFHGLMT